MRPALLHQHPLVLVLALGSSWACSSVDRGPEPDGSTPAEASGPTVATSSSAESRPRSSPEVEHRGPRVGDRAPALALDTLAGSRVALPEADADRAAVLIFGSFS